MREKNRTLRIAKSKVKHLTKQTYCGHLTPVEFLALVKAGILSHNESTDVPYAELYVKKGDSTPRWYYFDLGSVTLEHVKEHYE